MRAILDLAGVKDVLAKSLGSNNPFNVVKATMQAIESLRDKEYVFAKRGLSQ
jgi:small subunit ribosomal protein S5